ncbi:uncharacterized protein LOC120849223 [Ixodes scapularis]|uniref:uncharacterized protein LOC120849223 n=1 Tax=Ixodes scapularis TaxID=6945 RepID=UPI001C38A3F1|nr:uncharacterized protein LOC120849223 [Ixodes scapularis]
MCHGSCTAWSDLMRLTEDVFLQMSRKIKQLENENHRLVRQAALQKTREATFRSHLHKFFTADQLAALSRSSNRGSKWSNETMKKSLQMRFACGSLGYDLLLEGSFPLPSSRTLGRRLEGEHCPTGPQSLHGSFSPPHYWGWGVQASAGGGNPLYQVHSGPAAKSH